MLPLGKEIFNYELDQPLLFVNSQAFHRWKENMDPLKELINKKTGKVLKFFSKFCSLISSFLEFKLVTFLYLIFSKIYLPDNESGLQQV